MTTPEPAAPTPKRGPGRPRRSEAPPSPRPPKPRPKQKPQNSLKTVGKVASLEARKVAAVILEVLGGIRTTTDAALAIECSLPRYYQLEARAVEGLVAACEPKRPGPGLSVGREVEALRKKCARLERDVSRQQALVRAAHRTVGVAAVAPPTKLRSGKKRTRRPAARALVAVSILRPPAIAAATTTSTPSATTMTTPTTTPTP